MKTRIAIALIAVALVTACKKSPADATKAGSTTATGAAAIQTPAAPKPVPAQLPEIIARVNGAPVDRGEFERAVKSLEAQAGGPVPPEQRDTIFRQMLDQVVAMKLLSQESVAKKVIVPETEVDAQLAKVRGQFPNEEAFTAALAQRQMTPDKLKAEMRQQMQAMKLVEAEILPTVTVTDADLNDFYTKNPDKFQEPEAVHVSHILLRTPQEAERRGQAEGQGRCADRAGEAEEGRRFRGARQAVLAGPGQRGQRRRSRVRPEGPDRAGLRAGRVHAEAGAVERSGGVALRLPHHQDGRASRRANRAAAGSEAAGRTVPEEPEDPGEDRRLRREAQGEGEGADL